MNVRQPRLFDERRPTASIATPIPAVTVSADDSTVYSYCGLRYSLVSREGWIHVKQLCKYSPSERKSYELIAAEAWACPSDVYGALLGQDKGPAPVIWGFGPAVGLSGTNHSVTRAMFDLFDPAEKSAWNPIVMENPRREPQRFDWRGVTAEEAEMRGEN